MSFQLQALIVVLFAVVVIFGATTSIKIVRLIKKNHATRRKSGHGNIRPNFEEL